MNHYIQYHNSDKEGVKYLLADDGRFAICTRLSHVQKALGTVFLIVGVGRPRQYFLWDAFEIKRVETHSNGAFVAEGPGWRLSPPQRLDGADFDAFKSSCANFVGFRKIDDLPYCATLTKLAKKHRSAKSMKPFLQELLGLLKQGTEDYQIVQKQMGPAASTPVKPPALPRPPKQASAKKITRQPSPPKSRKVSSMPKQDGEQTKNLLALSVRQPQAEAILRGIKKIEFRSRPTKIRRRVQIYASLKRWSKEEDAQDMKQYKIKDVACDDLPRGVLVGTVEVYDCTFDGVEFNWHLRKPDRATKLLKPKKQPQPIWFKPF